MVVTVKIPVLYALQRRILEKSKPYRFRVLMCGRRFGKTSIIEYVITQVLQGKVVYLFAPDFASVAEIWDKTKENIGGAAKKIDNTTRIMTFHAPHAGAQGGIFRVIGLHSKGQQDKGRGAACDIAIYEETQSIDSDILQYHWENVMRPTLADRKGIAWFFGTPPNSKKHYFAKLYCKGALNNPNAQGEDVPMTEHISGEAAPSDSYISFRKTAYDNPYIDNVELEDIRRDHPPLVFMQEFEAKFVEYTSRPFVVALEGADGLLRENHIFGKLSLKPNLALPFYIAFDFNLGAMAATLWQKDVTNNLIICLAEFGCKAGEKVSIHHTTDQIRNWFWQHTGQRLGIWGGANAIPASSALRIYILGDATGTQGDPRARNGLTFYQTILRELGLDGRMRQEKHPLIYLPKANPHHTNTWAQINTWLSAHQQIFISPQCTRLRQDLKLTQTTEDKGIDKKAYDPHWFDTMRYFFNSCIPSKYNGEGRGVWGG